MKTSLFLLFSCLASALAQTSVVFDPPEPSTFLQNTSFAMSDGIGFVTSNNANALWSFDLSTGQILDPDGMALTGISSDVFLFANARAAIPGNFPSSGSNWGIWVADVSTPSDLQAVGLISLPSTSCISGQNVVVGADGVTGYISSFTDDKLYSFSTQAPGLVDPDGVSLPGNPMNIAIAGDRIVVLDSTTPAIIVVDASNPGALAVEGSIPLPSSASFLSSNNVLISSDGRTGFVASNERVLFSFDISGMTMLDPDGQSFGTTLYGGNIALKGTTVACVYSRGLSFIDVSNPSQMSPLSEADFGEVVAPQGSATVAFNTDGTRAAIPVIYPGNYIYSFDVASGQQYIPRYQVDAQPNYLIVFGDDDVIGTVCSSESSVWMISGMLGTPEGIEDGTGNMMELAASPNPMVSSTLIVYSPAAGRQPSSLNLSVFDVSGRLVSTLFDGSEPTEQRSFSWNGCDERGVPVPGGIYVVRASSPCGSATLRLAVLR